MCKWIVFFYIWEVTEKLISRWKATTIYTEQNPKHKQSHLWIGTLLLFKSAPWYAVTSRSQPPKQDSACNRIRGTQLSCQFDDIELSQWSYLRSLAATVCYDQIQQYFRSNRESIHCVWLPQFTVADLWKVKYRSGCHHWAPEMPLSNIVVSQLSYLRFLATTVHCHQWQ